MSNKYGNDILIFDGDFVSSAKGDLSTAIDYEKSNVFRFEGYYNMIFSIFNRLNTIRGEMPLHPEYGSSLPLLISKVNNISNNQSIIDAFNELLLDDPRIEEVESISIENIGNKVSVAATIKLTGKSESSVFVFPNFYIE